MSTTTRTTAEHVTSLDGTRIGFVRRGGGPGLVLVQGAGGTAYDYDDLARALSGEFTVVTPDRRGRGMSPKPYDRDHVIARDVEDLDAVLEATGAERVFGLSSGAMITLEAARTLPRVTRAAAFEPPFYPDGISHDGVRRLNAEIERGDLAAALVTSLRTSETLSGPVRALPGPVARLLARAAIRIDARTHGRYGALRDLIPAIRYDFADVESMDGRMATFASLEKPMLLLSGTRSAPYLRGSIRMLRDVLPQAELVELEGLDHSGSWNAGRGGRPAAVATALRRFFA